MSKDESSGFDLVCVGSDEEVGADLDVDVEMMGTVEVGLEVKIVMRRRLDQYVLYSRGMKTDHDVR